MHFRNKMLIRLEMEIVTNQNCCFLSAHHFLPSLIVCILPTHFPPLKLNSRRLLQPPHTWPQRHEPPGAIVSRIYKRKSTLIIPIPMANKAIQWNCRGYYSHYGYILVLIKDYNPCCFCLQETMHGLKPPRGFNIYHNSPSDAFPGQGLAIQV